MKHLVQILEEWERVLFAFGHEWGVNPRQNVTVSISVPGDYKNNLQGLPMSRGSADNFLLNQLLREFCLEQYNKVAMAAKRKKKEVIDHSQAPPVFSAGLFSVHFYMDRYIVGTDSLDSRAWELLMHPDTEPGIFTNQEDAEIFARNLHLKYYKKETA